MNKNSETRRAFSKIVGHLLPGLHPVGSRPLDRYWTRKEFTSSYAQKYRCDEILPIPRVLVFK